MKNLKYVLKRGDKHSISLCVTDESEMRWRWWLIVEIQARKLLGTTHWTLQLDQEGFWPGQRNCSRTVMDVKMHINITPTFMSAIYLNFAYIFHTNLSKTVGVKIFLCFLTKDSSLEWGGSGLIPESTAWYSSSVSCVQSCSADCSHFDITRTRKATTDKTGSHDEPWHI